MTDLQSALRQAAKLLTLAEHPNTSPEEAAAAAARAQEIMTRFQIERAAVEASTATKAEEISHSKEGEQPLAKMGTRHSNWKGILAQALARLNQCQVYGSHRRSADGQRVATIEVIGTASNVQILRYFYGYLVNEIERMTKERGRGQGKTWANNFRLGMVSGIAEQMRTKKEALRRQFESDAAMTSALVKFDESDKAVARWVKENLRLHQGTWHVTANEDGRSAGYQAGQKVALPDAMTGGGIKATRLLT